MNMHITRELSLCIRRNFINLDIEISDLSSSSGSWVLVHHTRYNICNCWHFLTSKQQKSTRKRRDRHRHVRYTFYNDITKENHGCFPYPSRAGFTGYRHCRRPLWFKSCVVWRLALRLVALCVVRCGVPSYVDLCVALICVAFCCFGCRSLWFVVLRCVCLRCVLFFVFIRLALICTLHWFVLRFEGCFWLLSKAAVLVKQLQMCPQNEPLKTTTNHDNTTRITTRNNPKTRDFCTKRTFWTTYACTDCTANLCMHCNLCFALRVLYLHVYTSDCIMRNYFEFE